MAVGTDIDVNRAYGGTGFDDRATGTLDRRLFIFWMDTCFHNVLAKRFITQGGELFKSQFIGQATTLPRNFLYRQVGLQKIFYKKTSRLKCRAIPKELVGLESRVFLRRSYRADGISIVPKGRGLSPCLSALLADRP